MRFLKPVLPALILLTAACRPPQIAALPQGPLRVEVHVEGLAPAFGEELKRCLEAELVRCGLQSTAVRAICLCQMLPRIPLFGC